MIAADTFAAGQLAPALSRLQRGERIAFSHRHAGPLAFTIEKTGRSFLIRSASGDPLGVHTTFAETWRNRPLP